MQSSLPTLQETVQRMQQHFANTGAFRPEDLLKVLGDPTKGVSVNLRTGYSNSTLPKWG